MSTERIDGIKYPSFDLISELELQGVYDHLTQRRDALEHDIERVTGFLAARGVNTRDQPQNPAQGAFEFDIPTEMLGERYV